MMLYTVILIAAACSAVFGTTLAGDPVEDRPVSTSGLCLIREGCKEIALTTPSQDEPSPLKDLCRIVDVQLKALGTGVCDPLLPLNSEKDGDDDEDHDDIDGQLPQASLALSLLGRTNYFSDCSEIHTAMTMFHVATSGVYDIKPVGLTSPISVYCDQTTDGGGWTVIQRRFDGSIDFNRPYNAFKYGFGSANGEQWLGLENMYRLTNQNAYELYIELEDWSGVVKYAKYASFSVGGSSTYFRLNVEGYSGTAGDGFGLSSYSHVNQGGQGFSARDVDHDTYQFSCAGGRNSAAGGWWYKACAPSALNGPYLRPSDYTSQSGYGIFWNPFNGSYENYLKKSKMMVRPVDFEP